VPEPARAGRIEYSDGRQLSGSLSLTPGSELKLHVGNQIKVLALERVQELRMTPEKESLEQSYRFPEAGKAIKETQGQPYPVRYLSTTVVLADGETIKGHLYTTVLYVEAGDNNQKVILLAKQRGNEGDTLSSLVYPARIVFGDAASPTATTVRLKLNLPGLSAGSEVAALSRGPLTRLEAKPSLPAGEYQMPSALGQDFFLAVKSGRRIVVGWPKTTDPQPAALVRSALPNSEDFFDDRRLLGVFRDEVDGLLYSLLLAARKGPTTLDETRSQPWRLEIYRWKPDEDGHRVMLAGQGYLFRGIGAKNEAVPAVELSDKLWTLRKEGEIWVAGE
jgi:hypothetical protein